MTKSLNLLWNVLILLVLQGKGVEEFNGHSAAFPIYSSSPKNKCHTNLQGNLQIHTLNCSVLNHLCPLQFEAHKALGLMSQTTQVNILQLVDWDTGCCAMQCHYFKEFIIRKYTSYQSMQKGSHMDATSLWKVHSGGPFPDTGFTIYPGKHKAPVLLWYVLEVPINQRICDCLLNLEGDSVA